MKRKFIKKLVNWKEKHINTPLLLSGARQTGKTYILKEFCKNYFKDSIYINFEEQSEFVSFFESSLNPEEILGKIEIYLSRKIDVKETIIFFDEIQVSERVISSLKYFSESKKGYKIVCAGSLLGVKLNRFKSSFPVGSVYFETLYPMDFDEFLMALDEEPLIGEIDKSYEKLKMLDDTFHKKALELYRAYLVIGGMPQSILEYLKSGKNFASFDRQIQENIIISYLADMAKYTNNENAVKVSNVYKSIPAQLAKENKKFQYKMIGTKAKKESYESAIDWLILSGLLLKTTKVELPQVPLTAYQKANMFKLYFSDVGLLCALSKINPGEIFLDTNMMYKGVLTENYVAQTLASNGYDLFYWESKSLAEIDFLINTAKGIVPVEVKSSDNTVSKSLYSYMERYKPDHGIRISTKNFGMMNGIKSIPLYAAYKI
ncbi:MAG: hypothetical protein A2452_01820 [Candidatus Firestonebacteria bacterium RIFOXYC2_FULL_39_67]|nr:MAG: hypothetical protein A2536_07330 [Candidatus Firestonebacteria bacterium RIFOXYD2_FULL_39_29]OGF53728.1 MAG: hypothetical protein A2452_01820 [Candidatus Firestonebacteria bacterium RIFOXYC2_FULL_39_67]